MTDERAKAGLAVRRDVLGAEHVDRSLANTNAFTRPLQDLLNGYCRAEVWTRPGLVQDVLAGDGNPRGCAGRVHWRG
jgi:alkylhydroperoxidase/carboxymuconolactone decarboxylase family protein YurZ